VFDLSRSLKITRNHKIRQLSR